MSDIQKIMIVQPKPKPYNWKGDVLIIVFQLAVLALLLGQ